MSDKLDFMDDDCDIEGFYIKKEPTFEEIKSKINKIMSMAKPYDITLLDNLHAKLDDLQFPIMDEIKYLQELPEVKRYIYLKKQYDWIDSYHMDLTDYYPK